MAGDNECNDEVPGVNEDAGRDGDQIKNDARKAEGRPPLDQDDDPHRDYHDAGAVMVNYLKEKQGSDDAFLNATRLLGAFNGLASFINAAGHTEALRVWLTQGGFENCPLRTNEGLFDDPADALLHGDPAAPKPDGVLHATAKVAGTPGWPADMLKPRAEKALPKSGETGGLWRNEPGVMGPKYLVLRRDGTVPEWEWFVLGAADPNAPDTLREYAFKAEKNGADPKYVADVREMARAWEAAPLSGTGDPDAKRHRHDDSRVLAILNRGGLDGPAEEAAAGDAQAFAKTLRETAGALTVIAGELPRYGRARRPHACVPRLEQIAEELGRKAAARFRNPLRSRRIQWGLRRGPACSDARPAARLSLRPRRVRRVPLGRRQPPARGVADVQACRRVADVASRDGVGHGDDRLDSAVASRAEGTGR